MGKALFVIDVQNDFTEGGALGVEGGAVVAAGVSQLLAAHPNAYDHVIASRDWHDSDNDNGGHFSENPDFVDTWPRHCVAESPGSDYHPAFDFEKVTHHVRKGQGVPAYSIFEGQTDDGMSVADKLDELGVLHVDIVGIATDHCVRASALGALEYGRHVRVFTDLIAGVDDEASRAALAELGHAGAEIVTSDVLEGDPVTSRGSNAV